MVKKMANKRVKIICPTCKGNGFYRVPYHLTHEETIAQCDDCDRQGHLFIDDDHKPEDLRAKGIICQKKLTEIGVQVLQNCVPLDLSIVPKGLRRSSAARR